METLSLNDYPRPCSPGCLQPATIPSKLELYFVSGPYTAHGDLDIVVCRPKNIKEGYFSVGARHLHGDRASPWIGAERSLARRSHIRFRDTHPTRRGLALCHRPGGGQGGEAGPRTVVHPDRSPFLSRYRELEVPYPLPILRRIRDDPGDDGQNRRTHMDLRRIEGKRIDILNSVD